MSSSHTNRTRAAAVILWRLVFCTALVLLIWPVKYQITRLLFLACTVGSFLGLTLYKWKVVPLRRGLMFSLLAIVILLIAPGRAADSERLRERYVRSLLSYVGTGYVWGGENRLGIDCSGLVRRSLMNALFVEGLLSVNPGLIRTGMWIWWHDSSANALREGYLEQTISLTNQVTLNLFDHAYLAPGDLAATHDGAHVMAYVGRGRWIEADPHLDEVVILNQGEADPWLNTEMDLVRWQWLK